MIMSSDLISCLRLDEDYEIGRVIVTKEINGCDSSFITSCVIAHCVRNKHPLLIVTTHNSVAHYHNIGLKMNYNLQKHVNDGIVQFYNLGEQHLNHLILGDDTNLKHFLKELLDMMLLMKTKYDTVSVIVDGLSHLFDLQYSLKEVNDFSHSLIKIIRDNNKSFVIFQCNVACDDDITYVMSNLLSHKAHVVVNVENLPSGWSLDVSGHVTIRYPGLKFDDEHMFSLDLKSTQYLFKLYEKGVKLFAPGTV